MARLLIILVVLVVLGPLIGKEFPHEIARWHHAAARQYWLAGEDAQAMDKATRALSWDPTNIDILTERAQWFGELQKYEKSLADWNQVIALQPKSVALYEQRSITYLHLQQGDQVLEDWKTIMELHKAQGFPQSQEMSQLFSVYNNRAYHYGVAKVKLDQALADADRAVELLGGNAAMLDRHGFPQYLQAYELYLESQYPVALAHSKVAIGEAEKTWQHWQRQEPDSTWQRPAIKLHQQRSIEFRRYQATLLFLRSRLYEQLKRPELRQQDLDQIKALGFAEVELRLPFTDRSNPLQQVLQLRALRGDKSQNIDTRSMILDTRGYILWRKNMAHAALWDLEMAVALADSQHRMYRALLNQQKKLAVDLRSWQRDLRLINKNLAVILYHRSLAYEQVHQPAKAEQDRKRIEELGYELSYHLF